MIRLPGQTYAGGDPHGYTHRDGIVHLILDDAVRNAALRRGSEGRAASGQPRFRVEAGLYCIGLDRNHTLSSGSL